MNETNAIITVRRGTPNVPPLNLNMHSIYQAEQRLQETRTVTPGNAPELRGAFNEACNMTTKYIAWIKYEILTAKKNLDLVKAEILLDKVPEILKQKGIKDNADIREAIINRDPQYQECLEVLNTLEATKHLLESKAKTFERAYWDCRDVSNDKSRIAALPNFSVDSARIALQEDNFIGKSKI